MLGYIGVKFVLSVNAIFSFVCCTVFYVFSPKTTKISLLITFYRCNA